MLLTTQPRPGERVGFAARIGISVLVRVPGVLRRGLAISYARVRGSRLEVGIANTGTINERLLRGQIAVTLVQAGRKPLRLTAGPRSLLPGGRGVVSISPPGRLEGPFRAVVRVVPTSLAMAGPAASRASEVTRSFDVRFVAVR